MATGNIEAGKRFINDDDSSLSPIWKPDLGIKFKGKTSSFNFSTGSTGEGDGSGDPRDPRDPNEKRPQLSDIVKPITMDTYTDAFGMTRAVAIIKIYNSSGEDIDGYAVALSLSDQQGGRQ